MNSGIKSTRLSSGVKSIETPKEVKNHPYAYGHLRALKKEILEKRKAAKSAYALQKGTKLPKAKIVRPPKPITWSRQKHTVKTWTAFENRQKVANTGMNREDIKTMDELGDIRQKFHGRPGYAITVANRANEREKEKLGLNGPDSSSQGNSGLAKTRIQERLEEVKHEREMEHLARERRQEEMEEKMGIHHAKTVGGLRASPAVTIGQVTKKSNVSAKKDDKEESSVSMFHGGLD
mgnify:CR=1 FL=1